MRLARLSSPTSATGWTCRPGRAWRLCSRYARNKVVATPSESRTLSIIYTEGTQQLARPKHGAPFGSETAAACRQPVGRGGGTAEVCSGPPPNMSTPAADEFTAGFALLYCLPGCSCGHVRGRACPVTSVSKERYSHTEAMITRESSL